MASRLFHLARLDMISTAATVQATISSVTVLVALDAKTGKAIVVFPDRPSRFMGLRSADSPETFNRAT
jgi:hypothetical protein